MKYTNCDMLMFVGLQQNLEQNVFMLLIILTKKWMKVKNGLAV
jgi:hypothetical protein